jgi:HPt (histidine-containing phosphotransfer) domain-containing protein
LTANAQLSSVDKSLFDDFLIKPLTLDTLSSVIYKWLDEQAVLFNEPSNVLIKASQDRIDLTVLRSMIGDNKTDLDNFLRTFDRKLLEYTKQLLIIKNNNDYKGLQFLLHKLKSSARTFGSNTLAILAETFESSISEHQKIDISYVVSKLDKEINMVLVEIDEFLKKD